MVPSPDHWPGLFFASLEDGEALCAALLLLIKVQQHILNLHGASVLASFLYNPRLEPCQERSTKHPCRGFRLHDFWRGRAVGHSQNKGPCSWAMYQLPFRTNFPTRKNRLNGLLPPGWMKRQERWRSEEVSGVLFCFVLFFYLFVYLLAMFFFCFICKKNFFGSITGVRGGCGGLGGKWNWGHDLKSPKNQ